MANDNDQINHPAHYTAYEGFEAIQREITKKRNTP